MKKEEMKSIRPLIVSYSYSGNTQRIAREIQTVTGGDWSEIYPWQPYPMAFPELLEQVRREIRSGCRPRLLENFRSPRPYGVIFVGSSNWCGTIAPPLASWICRHDLTGKILLPFYSHCGGMAGDFRGDIARLCPRADVREPLGIADKDGGYLPEILQQWFSRTGVAGILEWKEKEEV